MSIDEEALLAAIEAMPLDDAPRLIYADWLQERGDDAKAEYLRAVVALLHPPEDPTILAGCLSLAVEIDFGWRQRVGARFEAFLEGAATLSLIARVFQTVLSLGVSRMLRPWLTGKPIRVRSGVTREEAEEFLQTYEAGLKAVHGVNGEPFRLVIKPMETEQPQRPFT